MKNFPRTEQRGFCNDDKSSFYSAFENLLEIRYDTICIPRDDIFSIGSFISNVTYRFHSPLSTVSRKSRTRLLIVKLVISGASSSRNIGALKGLSSSIYTPEAVV